MCFLSFFYFFFLFLAFSSSVFDPFRLAAFVVFAFAFKIVVCHFSGFFSISDARMCIYPGIALLCCWFMNSCL